MLSITLLSALLAILPAAVALPTVAERRYPNPEPCTGNCSWIHDPSVIKKDNLYYRFSTSGNIAVATAPSLIGPWEYQHAALPNGTMIHVRNGQDIWAPEVHLIGDTYWLFYSVSVMGSQRSQIGVASSPDLSYGSFTDHGSLNLPLSNNYNLIDPNLFIDPDDNRSPLYFSFGSFWNDIHQTTLPPKGPFIFDNKDTISMINVISNSTSPATVQEGAFLYKHEKYYYYFFSVGWCCRLAHELAAPGDEYRVNVCRSSTPIGPYVDAQGRDCATQNGGTMVLASHGDVYAPGGQGVMVDDNGRTVMYYHYVKPSVGYKADQFFFGFNYLDFRTGWPVLV